MNKSKPGVFVNLEGVSNDERCAIISKWVDLGANPYEDESHKPTCTEPHLFWDLSGDIVHGGTEHDFIELTVDDVLGKEPTEWNGTGLPPVGDHVEFRYKGDDWEGRTCNPLGFSKARDEFWAHLDKNESSSIYTLSRFEFRPIRTEAEKQREADKEALKAMMVRKVGPWTPEEMIEAILDAGFTRKPDEQRPQ